MRMRYFAVGLVVLPAIGLWAAGAAQEPGPDEAVMVQRGAYIVNSVSMCADCHTPRDDRGHLDKARAFQGAAIAIHPDKKQPWADKAPDITGSGLAGAWGVEGMAGFLSTGVDPDGVKPAPPMPAYRLNADDARAVALYLKSLGSSDDGEE